MSTLEVALPIVLLLLAFLLKLLIDQSATIPLFIQSVYELPVNIAFLAACFIVAYTISSSAHNTKGLVYLIIYIAGSVLVIFFWRRSTKLFERNRLISSAFLAMLNYGACITGLVIAIRLLVGREL